MPYIADMPIDDERAAWLTGLRIADRDIHEALDAEVAAREIAGLHLRVAALHAQVDGLRGAVRVRDELLRDHQVAIAERDVRIETLLHSGTGAPSHTPAATLVAHLVQRAARVPGRIVRSATRVAGR
ncbi:hypothetical protein CTE05_12040 [Cellulomonas terrae]|uniref:Uncharacterized protein n=2 Tax=Cellulomonas terrae TaxID=311234 RepID=A0A511JI36_9CELL|nr:hypothetical protein CTE05_12040 [Cellulomonas terrae]